MIVIYLNNHGYFKFTLLFDYFQLKIKEKIFIIFFLFIRIHTKNKFLCVVFQN